MFLFVIVEWLLVFYSFLEVLVFSDPAVSSWGQCVLHVAISRDTPFFDEKLSAMEHNFFSKIIAVEFPIFLKFLVVYSHNFSIFHGPEVDVKQRRS